LLTVRGYAGDVELFLEWYATHVVTGTALCRLESIRYYSGIWIEYRAGALSAKIVVVACGLE
jgi:hypothetical protein